MFRCAQHDKGIRMVVGSGLLPTTPLAQETPMVDTTRTPVLEPPPAGSPARSIPPAPATPPRTPVLELRKISKRFGAVQALTDVDFEVYAGEVIGLVGDNGAGKSTLVKCISGIN